MTRTADDAAVEDAFEAALAGRSVPTGAPGRSDGVAAFTEAVRATADLPGRPSAALADLFADGLLADQSSPSTRTAPTAGNPSRSRNRRRRRFAMFFPALIAKFLSAGAVAQAATGAGIVLVAFTGAGTAGVLPHHLQHGFATVAETVGVQATDPADVPAEEVPAEQEVPAEVEAPAGEPATTEDGGADPQAEEPETVEEPAVAEDDELSREEWEAGPDGYPSFGAWVSAGAREGYANGATISHWARQKHVEWPGDEETASPEVPAEDSGEDTAEPGAEVTTEQTATTTVRGNSGNGNGNGNAGHGNNRGNGNGNSGRGNR